MKSNATINKIKGDMKALFDADIAVLQDVKTGSVEKLLNGNIEDGLKIIANFMTCVENTAASINVDGNTFDGCIAKATTFDTEKLTEINLAIRSKLKAVNKFKRTYTIKVDANIIRSIADAYFAAYTTMLDMAFIAENLEALNDKVAIICEENELPANFKFEVNPETAARVLAITDDMVVFNADADAIFNVAGMSMFTEGDGFNGIIRDDYIKKLVNQLKVCQTTVQLVKGNVGLIEDIIGYKTKKRASKLIRESYHRKAENLAAVKAGVGYYEGTATVDGAEVKVFALVEKTEDGQMNVILKPFDVATLLNVDVDVLAALA